MRCLITGGAGFIGSHLCESLLDDGNRVVVLDNESTGSIKNLKEVWSHPHFEYIKGSATDAPHVRSLVERVDEVYHLAAVVGVHLVMESPIHTIENNIHASEVVLKEVDRAHQRGRSINMFLASSSEVYGKNPTSRLAEEDDMMLGPSSRSRWCYAASKAVDEFLALAYSTERNMPIVIGRFFNVVGPRQSAAYGMVLPRFIDAALGNRKLTVYGDGQQIRCFAHVSDVIRVIRSLISRPEAMGHVFNIGNDEPIRILDLANRVIAAVNPTLSVELIDYAKAYPNGFEDSRVRIPDLQRIRAFLRFEPQFHLDEIIDSVLEWKRQQEL